MPPCNRIPKSDGGANVGHFRDNPVSIRLLLHWSAVTGKKIESMLETAMISSNNLEGRGVRFIYCGSTGLQEVLAAVIESANHDCFRSWRYVLHDFTAIESFAIEDLMLTSLTGQVLGASSMNPKLKSAIVTQNGDAIKAALLFTKATGRKVEIFSTLEEARKWAAQL